jgi:hypothetical protein
MMRLSDCQLRDYQHSAPSVEAMSLTREVLASMEMRGSPGKHCRSPQNGNTFSLSGAHRHGPTVKGLLTF